MRRGFRQITYVYAAQIDDERGGGFVKFGSSNEPNLRVQKLQAWSPYKIRLLASVRAPQLAENWLHDLMTPYRERNEWYWPTEQVVSAANYMIESGRLPMDICARAFDFLGIPREAVIPAPVVVDEARSERARLTWARRKCLIGPHIATTQAAE